MSQKIAPTDSGREERNSVLLQVIYVDVIKLMDNYISWIGTMQAYSVACRIISS